MKYLLFIWVYGVGCATYHPEAKSYDKDVHVISNDDLSSPLNHGKSKESIQYAIRDLKQNISMNKESTSKMLDLSDLYLMLNNIDKSEYWVRQALRYDMKNKRAKLILAGVFYRKDLLDMSSMMLEVLGGKDSTDASVLNLLALVEVRRKNHDLGMHLFSKALDVDPDNTAIRMNMGVQFFRYRRLSEAAIQFERVLNVVPEHRDAEMHLAMIDAAKGKYDQALDKIDDVLSYDNKNAVALYNRASILADMKEYDDAMDDLRLLLKSEEKSSARTQSAFALVKRLNTLIKDRDERMSYSEINRLASSLKNNSNSRSRKSASSRQRLNRSKPEVKRSRSEKKRDSASAVKTQEIDELEELEKELLGEDL
ncbi:MAG: tetratricopeptide repeat protein [Oligoflexales bacterium]